MQFCNRVVKNYLTYGGDDGGAGLGGGGAGGGPGAIDGSGAGPAAGAGGAVNDTPKVFNQAQVDEIVTKRFKKEREEKEKLAAELKGLRDQTGQTSGTIETLNAQIAELEKQTLSKEELAKRETERLQTAAKKTQDTLTSERDLFKGLYTDSTVEAAIRVAAGDSEIKALRPEQMVMLLKSQTRLSTKDVGGKQKFEVIVDWTETKDGESTVIQVPVKEALKRMKELPAVFGNLFESDARGGLGGDNVSGGNLNPASIDGIEAYKKNRAALINTVGVK